MESPVSRILREGMSSFDFAIIRHGFAAHGRDYCLIIQDGLRPEPGTYELTLTHVVCLRYETRIRDDVWQRSWSDLFTNYTAWERAGEPDGWVFGVNWSNAYPGISVPGESAVAADWSRRFGKPMHEVQIDTGAFGLNLIYSNAEIRKLSDETDLVERTINPV